MPKLAQAALVLFFADCVVVMAGALLVVTSHHDTVGILLATGGFLRLYGKFICIQT